MNLSVTLANIALVVTLLGGLLSLLGAILTYNRKKSISRVQIPTLQLPTQSIQPSPVFPFPATSMHHPDERKAEIPKPVIQKSLDLLEYKNKLLKYEGELRDLQSLLSIRSFHLLGASIDDLRKNIHEISESVIDVKALEELPMLFWVYELHDILKSVEEYLLKADVPIYFDRDKAYEILVENLGGAKNGLNRAIELIEKHEVALKELIDSNQAS